MDCRSITGRAFKLIPWVLQMDESEGLSRALALLDRALPAPLGRHPARVLELDLESGEDSTLGEWLIAACLLGARAPEARAIAAFEDLRAQGLHRPARLAAADPAELIACLESAKLPRAEALASLLRRICDSLVEQWSGSLNALAGTCDDLEALGTQLGALAAGFGRARIFRFLRPLRGLWAAASELPLDPSAQAAGEHLGLLDEGLDPQFGAGLLRHWIETNSRSTASEHTTGARLNDLESALEHLGSRSCRRDRVDRCPLADACPRRSHSHPA
jgi:endonuclease III